MKGRWRRFTAMLLACLMLFGLLFPDNAFAAENYGIEPEADTSQQGRHDRRLLGARDIYQDLLHGDDDAIVRQGWNDGEGL